MKVVERECDFGGVKFSDRIGKPLNFELAMQRRSDMTMTYLRLAQQAEKLAPFHKIHDHV